MTLGIHKPRLILNEQQRMSRTFCSAHTEFMNNKLRRGNKSNQWLLSANKAFKMSQVYFNNNTWKLYWKINWAPCGKINPCVHRKLRSFFITNSLPVNPSPYYPIHAPLYYKGYMDKIKGEGGGGGGRWVWLGWGGGRGRKGIQL